MAKKNIFQAVFYKIFRRKYEIVSFPVYAFGANNVRIRALRDIPRHGVKKGSIGGSVSSYRNLSQFGDCWVGENGMVYDKARVSGNAIVRSHAKVYGAAKIKGQSIVYGQAEVYGDALIKDSAEIYGQAKVFEHAKICGKAFIHSNAAVYGECIISGRSTVRDNAEVYGKAIIVDSDICGCSDIYGRVHVAGKTICSEICN